jgi:hypothetical protein
MAEVPARLTAITLGIADMRRSVAFYEALGFRRKLRATGDEVAFFETGASVLILYAWSKLAQDAQMSDQPRPRGYHGTTLAWNCASRAEVDVALGQAVAAGGRLLRRADVTDYGGYAGYFADPDDHVWEVVVAPGLTVTPDGRLVVPD